MRLPIGDGAAAGTYHALAVHYAELAAAAYKEGAQPPERVQAAAAISAAYSALAQTKTAVAAAGIAARAATPWWWRW